LKQIEAQIMGQGYILSCPEGGEAGLLQAVERVDATMSRIRDQGRIKARDRIAVLAALNFAFELAASKPTVVAAIRERAREPAPITNDETQDATLTDLISKIDQVLEENEQFL
jgi:cell division protein ZapA